MQHINNNSENIQNVNVTFIKHTTTTTTTTAVAYNNNNIHQKRFFGKNISNAKSSPGRICDPLNDFDRYIVNRQYIEILGGALPEKDQQDRTWYKAFYLHPAPGEQLTFSHFEPAPGQPAIVEVKQ